MPQSYPLLLDVTDRLIVIIGGGGVAVRKALGLIEAGANRVRVVAERIDDRMPEQVERINVRYQSEHVRGAGLVFAATDDPAVNDTVVKDARAMGVLVCRADRNEDHRGDFSTPAMIRNGPMLVTVSTDGSPALAAKIRDEIAETIDPRWPAMAEAMLILRPKIRDAAGLDPSRRQEIFRHLATDEAMNVLHSGGVGALCAWLAGRIPELSDI